ncbi:O-antigen ligase family protein [Herbaspirillum seropedicae]|uniref:O-antigen ligase family protein n=1 Tax=Herbaspirillum seropedicae TaxID=964 RepID=UPI000847D605|nr:O-antigen ligase family protein [Herbaspirillum seropedicae]AON55887.1 O-antigen polymerase [Herbaspirillum seropedicae]
MSILSRRSLTFVLLLAFSSLGLVVPNLANACLFLLTLLGIAAIFQARRERNWPSAQFPAFRLLCFVMASAVLAVLIHQIGVGSFVFRELDRPLRLAFFGLVFFAMWQLGAEQLDRLRWAWILACLLCFIKAWIVTEGGSLPNSGSLGFMAGIAFSNAALLLGVWLLLSLQLPMSRLQRWLSIGAIILALGVTFLVKTRGTWLVLPFYAVFFIFYLRQLSMTRKAVILLFPLLLVGVGMLSNAMVRERIVLVGSDIRSFADGTNKETSLGQRFQVWQGSWELFREQPWLGVGRDGFKTGLHRLSDAGKVSELVAELPHSHNGMLFQMALWGVWGLIAWLLIYFVPLALFWRDLGHASVKVRTYAAMGVSLCLGYWVFDFSDVMFFWVILNGFYAINLAIFFRAIVHAKQDLSGVPQSAQA